ncbi:3-phosphoserine/phosphohydroxythreonine transaminase [bacterium]|nr:3-phosphoserine/phosphohydroxythreonine transaminase [bacterium]
MAHRIWNFNAGPATLPLPVLERIKADLPNFNNTGMAFMEMSHRSKPYDEVHQAAKSLARELWNIPESHHILLLQGGASTQFAMIPMNLLREGQKADYINTGTWSKKAIKEAKLFGEVTIAASSDEDNFSYVPTQSDLNLTADAEYVHMTTNNTIAGTQFHYTPDTGKVPLIADMSSDIMSRPLDISKFGMIYAGAQKNLGPSGVTMVIIRDDLVAKCKEGNPTMFTYTTHVDKDSLFNTIPTYSVYILKLVLDYMKEIGGIAAIEKENNAKGKTLYGAFDAMSDFYRCPVREDSRSLMNVVFRLPNEDLEKQFIAEAAAAGLGGLKGHRSVGGIRASVYNAMPLEGVKALTNFMKDFAGKNG